MDITKVNVVPDEKSFQDYQRGDIGQPLKPNSDQWMICCPGCGVLGAVLPDNIISCEDGTVSTKNPLRCHGRRANREYSIGRNEVRWLASK